MNVGLHLIKTGGLETIVKFEKVTPMNDKRPYFE